MDYEIVQYPHSLIDFVDFTILENSDKYPCCYSNLGSNYENISLNISDRHNYLAGSYKFAVDEIEIFKIMY